MRMAAINPRHSNYEEEKAKRAHGEVYKEGRIIIASLFPNECTTNSTVYRESNY